MVKRARLVKEAKATAKAIKFLILLVFASGFLSLYSYENIKVYETERISDFQLASQKAFDVFVTIREGSPIILLSANDSYVCEGSSMDYPVIVLDFNKIIPSASLSIINPFYIIFFSKIDQYTNEFRIVSPILTKEHAGGVNQGSKMYFQTIYMADGELIASKELNITVIEINNAPIINNIGVRTVWISGDNNIFNYQVNANDIEDGNSNSLNLNFNISFEGEKLFNISPNGTMYFKPNSSQIGVYNISVCVKDRGIQKPHPNISICGQDGSNLTNCNNFSLTVTDKNRPPIIINHTPFNLSFSISGEENTYFNITNHDPDGTLVDVYWYVDKVLKKYDSRKDNSDFSFSYICGFSGRSNVTVVITDGEFNDSVQWNINIANALCPTSPRGDGGGGGVACKEKWVCNDWYQCKNLKENYMSGKVDYKVNTLISGRCNLFRWDESACGFQIRQCQDLKKCKSNLSMPGIMRECYYTKNPNCNDGIKNCHNSSCEKAIDCGGPCPACPTCNDGIKNQNEEGIDCGGVCGSCSKEIPKSQIDFFKILMQLSLIFLILALIGITTLGIRYILLKKRLGEISHDDSLNEDNPRKRPYRSAISLRREL